MENGDRHTELELQDRSKDGPKRPNGSNEKDMWDIDRGRDGDNGEQFSLDTPAHAAIREPILLNKKHKVPATTAVKLRIGAIIVSWVSAILSAILGTVAIVFAALLGSQSLFSFGLDSILDCLSSVVILWRFHGRDTIYSNTRELRACVMIGALFVLSGLLLATRCVFALMSDEMPKKPKMILIMSSINAFCCLVLGGAKVYLGVQLESRALVIDSIITFTGAAMSMFTLIFSAIYEYNKHFWYLDDSFGLLCSVFLVGYGIRVIIKSRMEMKSPEETLEE